VAKERIDIAISIGTRPPATTLVRRHLATWLNVLVAARVSRQARDTANRRPALPACLRRSAALASSVRPADRTAWRALSDFNHTTITSNNQVTIRQFTLAGCGLSFGVVPEMTEEWKAERLARVLRHWPAPSLSVDALMLPRVRQPARVRAALEALPKHLAWRDAT
jgi:DNA-binding transcriptional LysR family regulator